MYDEMAKQQLQYAGQCAPSMSGASISQPTIRQRLERQKASLSEQMAAIDNAIAALDATPDFENCANALAKAQCY